MNCAPSFGFKCIVIGTSMGGPNALYQTLPDLCAATTLPILIVQHMSKEFTPRFAQGLNDKCGGINGYLVQEAHNDQTIKNNNIYLAPGDKHMALNGNRIILLGDAPKENGCRPAADVLFRTAAWAYKSRLLGIVLTGMGQDGTEGSRVVKENGGYIIAQDQASSAVWGMPKSVIMAGLADNIISLTGIPAEVQRLCSFVSNRY